MSLYAVINPATGETLAEHPTVTNAELGNAVLSAADAFEGWSRKATVADRAALVARVAELHTERRQELAEIVVREVGKPLDQALAEVDFAAAIYEY